MQEKFKRETITALATTLNAQELKQVDFVLSIILTRYEITEKTTEIVAYRDGLPEEIKSFLVSKSIKGLTKASLAHYKRTLIHFSNNIGKDVKAITSNDIKLYLINYEHTHDVSKSTLDDKRRVLNSFFTWMVREDIIDKNPMLRIDPIKCDKRMREPLTDIELEQMRNAAVTLREKALLEILYSTGARVSEITALNRSDLDYNAGRVKVFGKGKKERYCFLNARAQLAVKKYLFSRLDKEEALFTAGKKPYNRLGKGTIEKEIGNIGIRADINRNVFPHLLRHTFATHMLAHGASIAEVQTLLGHESPATTQIYAKLDLHKLHAVHQRCII
ncbi:MAG: tyrosine-type recombinase/integrase [Anaerocolumna aminovalerica]|uniref:tyrosine-type recombinase/integrase n=1 Tax=Anaerocolumna aminovalerica TaxID=1527 RepID=UPI0029149C01|nr:tyrosine-type recombinase/integrase [Anaerocolumna aminovalerica]MDU6263702.1 tyrosine-type recombinase/integrase [Anaerocolumna aminovalerica]